MEINYPQLQFTPFIYRDREAFRVARPYQLLCAYVENRPENRFISIPFGEAAVDIGKRLVEIDSGILTDPIEKSEVLRNIYLSLQRILENRKLYSCQHDELENLLDLAYTTLITGNDPYSLSSKSGKASND